MEVDSDAPTPAAAAPFPAAAATHNSTTAHTDKDALVADFRARTRRRVLMGTCGWNDESIGRCGRFYPTHIRTATERLKFYATHFPAVEVDTSNYAIPPPARIADWMNQTPPTFKVCAKRAQNAAFSLNHAAYGRCPRSLFRSCQFHFKVFGLFTATNIVANALPTTIRHLLTDQQIKNGKVKLQDTDEAFKQALWSVWNQTLRPVHQAGKLGLVIFQFHLGFLPTKENKAYIEWCRSCLDPEYEMGIEFRSRAWFQSSDHTKFSDDDFVAKTVRFARRIGCVLIAEDDLAHEVTGRFIPLPPGQTPVRLPIILKVTSPSSVYIRMHRRQGTQRLLGDDEFREWAERFAACRATSDLELQGPMHFLIGTDHEDQPIINSKKMMAALQAYDLEQQLKYEEAQKLPAAASSADSTAAAASSSAVVIAAASSSSSAAPSSPPEPLAFDYPRYYKQSLARLPNAPHTSTASQLSLGSFFKASAATPASPAKFAPPPAAAVSAHTSVQPPSTFATTFPAAPRSFVLASSLPHVSIKPAAASSSTPSSSSVAATRVASPIASAPAPAAAASSPSRAAPAAPSSDDLAAQIAAIDRACAQGGHVSPAATKRKTPPATTSSKASPAKKSKPSSSAKKATPASPSVTAFFFKKV